MNILNKPVEAHNNPRYDQITSWRDASAERHVVVLCPSCFCETDSATLAQCAGVCPICYKEAEEEL